MPEPAPSSAKSKNNPLVIDSTEMEATVGFTLSTRSDTEGNAPKAGSDRIVPGGAFCGMVGDTKFQSVPMVAEVDVEEEPEFVALAWGDSDSRSQDSVTVSSMKRSPIIAT